MKDFGLDEYDVSPRAAPWAVHLPRLAAASRPSFAVPHLPTPEELAGLVHELFREGTLTFEQLCMMAGIPDLAPLLTDALHAAPAQRKPMAAE